MNIITLFLKYIYHRITAVNKHSIHSPFLFEFMTKVIPKDNYSEQVFSKITPLINSLKKNKKKIKITDFGAGSKINNSNVRTISNIAKHSIIKPKYAKLMFRIINFYKCNTILEIGTSFGTTSIYLASSKNKAKIYTLEGCKNIAQIAKTNFNKLEKKNIFFIEGEFENTLKNILEKIKKVDFFFIDGNHKYNSTINYFQTCIKYSKNESIFIFDDIRWSSEMYEAWEYIKKHPKTKNAAHYEKLTCTSDY